MISQVHLDSRKAAGTAFSIQLCISKSHMGDYRQAGGLIVGECSYVT